MLYDIASKVPHFDSHSARNKELKQLQASWARKRTLDDVRFDHRASQLLAAIIHSPVGVFGALAGAGTSTNLANLVIVLCPR